MMTEWKGLTIVLLAILHIVSDTKGEVQPNSDEKRQPSCFPYQVRRKIIDMNALNERVNKLKRREIKFYHFKTSRLLRDEIKDICGRKSLESRIVSGKEAVPNAFPWVARVTSHFSIYIGSVDARSCAGTLISNEWLVTAAHCLYIYKYNISADNVRVELGIHHTLDVMFKKKETFNIQTVPRKNLHIYPLKIAEGGKGLNPPDIALIRLNNPIRFSQTIRPACLPRTELRLPANCTAVGWGLTSPTVKLSPYLKRLDIWLVHCKWKRNLNYYCGWSLEGGHSGLCGGDTGGPILCQYNNQYYLTGVIAFSKNRNCAQQIGKDPSMFTNVTHFIPWIESVMKLC